MKGSIMKADFNKRLVIAGMSAAVLVAPSANALEIQAGDWKFWIFFESS